MQLVNLLSGNQLDDDKVGHIEPGKYNYLKSVFNSDLKDIKFSD